MRETVYIRFDRTWPDELLWLRVGAEGPGVPETGGIEALAAAAAGHRLVVLAPAEAVLLAQATIPARNRQRVIQALPYALEDRLVQDVELLHFAIGPRAPDGALNVAVVERAQIDGWLDRLRRGGLEPEAILPETLATPYEEGAWTVLVDGPVTIVRSGPQSGFAIDSDNVEALLGQALAEAGEARPGRLLVHAGEDAASAWPQFPGIETRLVPLDEDALVLMAHHVDERASINLLQGEYNRREQFGRLYRPWIASAAALGLLVVVHTAMLAWDYMTLSREADRLQQAIEQTYREAFPDATRIVNPRVQMERGLAALGGGAGADAGGFLDMVKRAAPALKNADGVVLQRVNYRDRRLDLALAIGNLQQLDQLKQRLESESGLEIEIQSASAAGDRVDARIQLRAAP